MKKYFSLLALFVASAAYGQSAPVLVTFEGTPANTQPSQAQLNAGVLGTTGGGAFNGGAPAGFTVVVATNSPSFPSATLIGGVSQLGNGTHVYQWTTGSTPASVQYIFRTGSKTKASFGVYFCADFDINVVGGQYSNNSITANGGNTQNILLSPVTSPEGLSLENNGSFTTGALAYHGGNCLTDPTLAAWRWITIGYLSSGSQANQMNVYDANINFLQNWTGVGSAAALNPGSAQFGITGNESEAAGHHIYWKNEMIDDVNGVFPLLPNTSGSPIASNPSFFVAAGTYTLGQAVNISSATAGATICYTVDGSTPTTNGGGTCTHGTTFANFVNVSSTQTIKAIATESGFTDSSIVSAVYTINPKFWTGIIAPPRATDWSTAGVIGGIPSASWTQSGSTIAAYTGTAATINTALSACGANQYVLLGGGTFSLSTGILSQQPSCELRLSASTVLAFTNGVTTVCGAALVCFNSTGAPNNFPPPTTIHNWTAGFVPGTTQITLDSVSGLSVGNVIIATQCEDGTSGNPTCSGTVTDLGTLFNCSFQYASSSSGCSFDGPDGGLGWSNGAGPGHEEQEMFTVTAISGTLVTLDHPLMNPNWATARSPVVWFFTPLKNVGMQGGMIDGTAVRNLGQGGAGVKFVGTSNHWLHGTVINHGPVLHVWNIYAVHGTIEQNYFYQSVNPSNVSHAIDDTVTSDMLIQNNICQQLNTCFHIGEGPDNRTVVAYNFQINSASPNDNMLPGLRGHSNGGNFILYEGNVFEDTLLIDDTHGSQWMSTPFRNALTGWESCATTGNCGASAAKDFATNALEIDAYNRYMNLVGNIFGTNGFHNTYITANNSQNKVELIIGSGNGAATPPVPNDPLVLPSTLLWGNWDAVTGSVRLCGNSSDTGWNTTCLSTSEVPTGAPAYPNPVPTLGDTAIGQSAMPASFYLTAKPVWFGSIPFPPIGPDVTTGNIVQCAGVLNTAGKFNGLPVTNISQCAGSGIISPGWGGHFNMTPAMACYLNTMAGTPDGTGSILTFSAPACYPTGSGGAVSVAPASLNFGSVNTGVQSPGQTVTVTNGSGSTITFTGTTYSGTNGADFSSLLNLCGGTLLAGAQCSITASFKPSLVGVESGQMNIAFTGATGSPLAVTLSGVGVQNNVPAPAQTMMSLNLAGCTPQKITTFCFTADGHIYVSTCGKTCAAYVPYGVSSISVNGGPPGIGNVALTIPTKAITTSTTTIQ